MKTLVKMKLVGIDGNAFNVMATWERHALEQGWTKAETSEVLNEAMEGDYNHLLRVIMKNVE